MTIENKMPKIETLRKYYPNVKMTDTELLDLAEWVRQYTGKKNGISPDNKILAGIIAHNEYQSKKAKTWAII